MQACRTGVGFRQTRVRAREEATLLKADLFWTEMSSESRGTQSVQFERAFRLPGSLSSLARYGLKQIQSCGPSGRDPGSECCNDDRCTEVHGDHARPK